MISILDFIVAKKIEFDPLDYKVHLATEGSICPMEAYLKGEFKQWQEYQTRKNFNQKYIISLIKINDHEHKWLYAGVYKVLSQPKEKIKTVKYGDREHYVYDTILLEGQDSEIGRIVVHYHRKDRASYLVGKNPMDGFKISQITEQPHSISNFPGFRNINISLNSLTKIINSSFESWKGALSSVSGIYLITDTKNKKHYVGSAYGQGGIWSRWSEYALNTHGNNKLLQQALGKTLERDYLKFSVLEILNQSEDMVGVIARENYWKEILMARLLGYNKN